MPLSTAQSAKLGPFGSAFTLDADVLGNYAHGVISASTILKMEADRTVVEKWLANWEKPNDTSSLEAVEAVRRIVSVAQSIQASLEEKLGEDPEGTRTQIINAINKVHKLGDGSEAAWVGIATPTVLYVKHDFLINTAWGNWLMKKQRMGLTITFLLLTITLIVVVSQFFGEPQTMWEGERELTSKRYSSAWWVLMFMVSSITLIHVAHRLNRDILYMTCQYFEFIMIVGSQIGTKVFKMYNMYATFYRVGLYDVEWQIWEILSAFLIEVPATVFVASMDGFHVRRKGIKCVIIAFFLLGHAWYYVHGRYLDGCWSSQDMELFGYKLGTAQQAYLQMESQTCIFLGKLLLAQLFGHIWVMLKPEYLPPKHDGVVDDREAFLSADSTADQEDATKDSQRVTSSGMFPKLAW